MTFQEKYNQSNTWHEKALVMGLFHLTMCHRQKEWTITHTAKEFGCSIGLVSENLRLAKYISQLISCQTRQEALNKLQTIG